MFARLINIALRLVCPRRSALSSSASVVTPVVCPLAFVLPPSNAALVCRTLCMLPQTRGPLALVLRSSIVSLLHYFALFLAFDVGFGFAFFFFTQFISEFTSLCHSVQRGRLLFRLAKQEQEEKKGKHSRFGRTD